MPSLDVQVEIVFAEYATLAPVASNEVRLLVSNVVGDEAPGDELGFLGLNLPGAIIGDGNGDGLIDSE